MTQAAGFYNTCLESDQPVLIIEPLNGYRLREKTAYSNMGEFKTLVGIHEDLKMAKMLRWLLIDIVLKFQKVHYSS